MPGDSGVTVVTNARVFYTTRAAAGASDARHSLRPLIGEGGMLTAKLGRSAPREYEFASEIGCLKFESGSRTKIVLPYPPLEGEGRLASQDARRGGVTVSQLGRRSKRETVTPPRRSFHSRRPSPSRGG